MLIICTRIRRGDFNLITLENTGNLPKETSEAIKKLMGLPQTGNDDVDEKKWLLISLK